MAKFGIEATNISDPSLGGASYVRPATADTSGNIRKSADMGLVNTLANQALPIYTSMQKGEINQQTQNVIQEYMNQRENPELTKQSLGQMRAQDVTTSLFKPQGEQLSAVEQSQKERLATYQQALEQGVMTQEEFSDRVTANLREMTNRNPGLYDELKGEAARVLELSGITGIMKSDKLIAESKSKQESDAFDSMRKRADTLGEYHDVTTKYWDLAMRVKARTEDKQLYDLQVREKDRFAMASQEDARHWVTETQDPVIRGSLDTAQQTILEMANTLGITAETYSKHKIEVEGALDKMFAIYHESIPVNIRQEANVQEGSRMYQEHIKQLKDRFSNMASGEDFKKVLTNEVEIRKAIQDKRVRENVDVASLELAMKMATSTPEIITKSPEFRAAIINANIAITSGNFKSPALANIAPKSKNDTSSASLINGAVNLSKQSGDYTSFNRTIEALNTQTSSIENPTTRLQYLRNNVTAISKATDIQLDSVGLQHVNTTIDQFLKDPKFGVGTLVDTVKGKQVRMTVTPETGRLLFVGPDATQFNTVYANNVNLATQAYAKAHGVSEQVASKAVIREYLGDIIRTMQPTTSTAGGQVSSGMIRGAQ